MLRYIAGCALLASAACSVLAPNESGDSLLVLRRSVYAPAETVTVRFTNRSGEQIGYGACSLRLERRTGSEWVVVGPEHTLCIDILYILEPGESRDFRFPLGSDLEPGRYRLYKEILPATRLPLRRIHSPEFTVRPLG